MSKFKRILAAALPLVMLVAGTAPATAFAQETAPAAIGISDATETKQTDTDGRDNGSNIGDGNSTATNEGTSDNAENGTAPAHAGGNVTIDLDSLLDVLFSGEGDTTFSLGGEEFSLDGLTEAFLGMAGSAEAETGTGDAPEEGESGDTENFRVGTVVTGGSRLNLRSGGGTDNPIIGQLAPGDEVKVLGEENGWYEVEITQKTGYVCGKYLDVADVGQEAPESGPAISDEDFMKLFLALIMQGMGTGQEGGTGLTPDGNLTLVDDIGSLGTSGAGQQFITVVTKAGNYFYLVIDRDDDGNENVHFLNMVDEADLFALMEEDGAAQPAATPEPEPTEEPEEPEPTEEPEKEEKSSNMLPILLVLLLLGGGGGGWFYLQMKKKKQAQQEKPDPDADYFDGEEDEGFELPDDMGEDESPDDGDGGFDDTEPV